MACGVWLIARSREDERKGRSLLLALYAIGHMLLSAGQRPALHGGLEVLERGLSDADRAVDVFWCMGH